MSTCHGHVRLFFETGVHCGQGSSVPFSCERPLTALIQNNQAANSIRMVGGEHTCTMRTSLTSGGGVPLHAPAGRNSAAGCYAFFQAVKECPDDRSSDLSVWQIRRALRRRASPWPRGGQSARAVLLPSALPGAASPTREAGPSRSDHRLTELAHSVARLDFRHLQELRPIR